MIHDATLLVPLSERFSTRLLHTGCVFFFKNNFSELPLEHESFLQTRHISCCDKAKLLLFGSSVQFSDFPHYPIMVVVRNSNTKANNYG